MGFSTFPTQILVAVVLVLGYVAAEGVRPSQPLTVSDAAATATDHAPGTATRMRASDAAPTMALQRREIALSTLDPVPLYIPDLRGAVGEAKATSVVYYGPGYYPESTVYALITGAQGEGEGPKTTLMYEGASEVYVPHLLRTADMKDGNGTITGIFNIRCKYDNGLGHRPGYCEYERLAAQKTTSISTFNTTIQAQTTITPVAGELQQRRQSMATGLSTIPPAPTQSGGLHSGAYALRYSMASSTMSALFSVTILSLVFVLWAL